MFKLDSRFDDKRLYSQVLGKKRKTSNSIEETVIMIDIFAKPITKNPTIKVMTPITILNVKKLSIRFL
ncbi:MAG: hypothetical protein KAR35_09520, partial [Candidatus Heimdallarchaeota archaeon]|nr:hypothetical protein [Candidatus Heimdallarchaeota archaeon]